MPWGVIKQSNPLKVTSNPCVIKQSNPLKSTSNPCLVVKAPQQKPDEYMCPTSNYRELQKKLRLSFQKKFENRKNQSMCLHPCDFPYCVENCRYANDHEHQSHRCDNHQVIPKAYSQQLKPSPRHAITTLVNANKDLVKRRKYSTRRNMYVKLTAKAQKQGLKDLNKALLEILDNLKWPLSTKRDHVF